MRLFVGVTDDDWVDHLRAIPGRDEVNFWQPRGKNQFRALSPGEPFLFKLHSPNNVIAGLFFFRHFSLAWEAFGEKNGAASFAELRRRLERFRCVAQNR